MYQKFRNDCLRETVDDDEFGEFDDDDDELGEVGDDDEFEFDDDEFGEFGEFGDDDEFGEFDDEENMLIKLVFESIDDDLLNLGELFDVITRRISIDS